VSDWVNSFVVDKIRKELYVQLPLSATMQHAVMMMVSFRKKCVILGEIGGTVRYDFSVISRGIKEHS